MSRSASPRFPVTRHDVVAQLHRQAAVMPFAPLAAPPDGERLPEVGRLPLLIREPRRVRFADRAYDLRREGLYRFWDWGKCRYANATDMPRVLVNRQRYACVILYRRDLRSLLGALATLHIHGYAHQRLPYEEQLARLKRGSLSLTCSYVASFLARLLPSLGVRTRVVAGLRLRDAYNTYENGHSLVEVWSTGERRWILADVDMHKLFADPAGSLLDLAQVSERANDGRPFDLVPLTPLTGAVVDQSEALERPFAANTYFEPAMGDPELLMRWYRLMFAVPFVRDEDGSMRFHTPRSADRARVERYSLSYRSMDIAAWYRRFYDRSPKESP